VHGVRKNLLFVEAIRDIHVTCGYCLILANVSLFLHENIHTRSLFPNVSLFLQKNIHTRSLFPNVSLFLQKNIHTRSLFQ